MKDSNYVYNTTLGDIVLCLQDLYAEIALLQEQVDALSGR